MNQFSWDNESTAKLKRMVLAGHSYSDVAAEIGVSRNAAIGKGHRLGLVEHKPRAAAFPKVGTEQTRAKNEQHQQARASQKAERARLADEAKAQEAAIRAAMPTGRNAANTPLPGINPISIMGLNATTCRWPLGSPGADGFGYCGATCPVERPYCAVHQRMSYAPRLAGSAA